LRHCADRYSQRRNAGAAGFAYPTSGTDRRRDDRRGVSSAARGRRHGNLPTANDVLSGGGHHVSGVSSRAGVRSAASGDARFQGAASRAAALCHGHADARVVPAGRAVPLPPRCVRLHQSTETSSSITWWSGRHRRPGSVSRPGSEARAPRMTWFSLCLISLPFTLGDSQTSNTWISPSVSRAKWLERPSGDPGGRPLKQLITSRSSRSE